MELQDMIEKMVKKLTSNETLMKQFRSNPVKALESVLGKGISQDMLEAVATGVKAKLAAGKADDLLGAVKKLF